MAPPRPADGILLSGWAAKTQKSALQDMLAEASGPGILSFALGLPAAELFPVEKLAHSFRRVLDTDPRALQYGPPSMVLKSHVVDLMAKRGVLCTTENVFLTSGAQQGLNLLARLLLKEHSQVLLEELTYPGFRQVLEPFQPQVLTVPTNRISGMDLDYVEKVLRRGSKPAMLYTIPEGHNPLGSSMAEENRKRLARLAQEFQVPVLEDDPYGFLFYENAPPPALRAFDEQWILYVGSFSKLLAPALRAGWLVVPPALIPKLAILKEASDINSATFTQRAITHFLDQGHLAAHLDMLRQAYSLRRDAMLAALDERFSGLAEWNKPSSGFFVWLRFLEETNTHQLLRNALANEKVAFIPGAAFSDTSEPRGANCLRLNFSALSEPLIREGMDRLARAFTAMKSSQIANKYFTWRNTYGN